MHPGISPGCGSANASRFGPHLFPAGQLRDRFFDRRQRPDPRILVRKIPGLGRIPRDARTADSAAGQRLSRRLYGNQRTAGRGAGRRPLRMAVRTHVDPPGADHRNGLRYRLAGPGGAGYCRYGLPGAGRGAPYPPEYARVDLRCPGPGDRRPQETTDGSSGRHPL